MEESQQQNRRSIEDHDLLIRLDEKVGSLIEKVNKLTDDHENRILHLENWRWYLIGIASAAGTLAGIFGPRLFGN